MRRVLRFGLSLGLCSLLFTPAASAQGQPGRGAERRGQAPRGGGPRILRSLDRDGDGELSKEELAEAPRALRRLDRDGDGELSGPEIANPFSNSSRFRGSRPGSRGVQRLSRAGLHVGDPLPALTIYDARGREFPLAELKGDYTVLVFGCLT